MVNYVKVFIIGLKYLKKRIFDDDHICAATFIIIFSFLIPYRLIQDKSLEKHTAYAVGIIYKNEMGGKTSGKYYEFYVGDTVYKSVTGYGGLSKIREGDSIIVAYDYTNPKNNQVVGYFIYTLDRSKLPDTVFHRQLIDRQRRPIKDE